MPAPLANRFSHYEVEANLDDWVAWAFRFGIDERLIAFLRFRPDLLFDFDPAQNPVAFPSPRSWEFAHRALDKYGADGAMLLGALQACVGAAAGIELDAYVRNLDQMPDVDAIVAGREVNVPADLDLQYAVASSLVSRAVRADDQRQRGVIIGNILDYAGRFPHKEMGVMLVSDLHQAVGAELFSLPQFSAWAGRVADVMLAND
jgi:hypothetical protein